MDIADPFARQLMARYLRHRRADLSLLREALDAEDLDTVRRTGHNLHGSGGAYGIDAISEIGRELEDAAMDGDLPGLQHLLAQLTLIVTRLSAPSVDN